VHHAHFMIMESGLHTGLCEADHYAGLLLHHHPNHHPKNIHHALRDGLHHPRTHRVVWRLAQHHIRGCSSCDGANDTYAMEYVDCE
jgi:hypothetical protein